MYSRVSCTLEPVRCRQQLPTGPYRASPIAQYLAGPIFCV